MKCPQCQFDNPQGYNFCGKCGTPLTVRYCKGRCENPAAFKHSDERGEGEGQQGAPPAYARRSPLDYTPPFLVERVLQVRSALKGEKKLVSVLFADVVGFTAMAEKLDPEDVHEIMDGCFEILGREIHGAGGTINQYTGDGVMALFGAPIAYDDPIRPACHAALQAQRRLAEYKEKIADRYGVSFQMRMGIHCGRVVVGTIGDDLRLDYTAVGDTTNVAARLEALAGPGEIMVSDGVRGEAESQFRFRDAGIKEIRGRSALVHAFVLVAERDEHPFNDKGEAAGIPFVDREKETALLKQAFAKALTDGPKLVLVLGEAGVGKSRLLHQFLASVQDDEAFLLEGHCRPYGQTVALHPLAGMFQSYLRVSEDEPLEKIWAKVQNQFRGLPIYPQMGEAFGLFQEIRKGESGAGASVAAKKRQLFRLIRDLLVFFSAKRPIIMVVEDIQWADASTRAFLSYLAGSSEGASILILCAGRRDPGHWGQNLPDHLIPLEPLSKKEGEKLLSSALGTKRLDPRISGEILSNAGGNPLFLVEMAETLKRQDLMICGSIKCTLALPVNELKIPDTIQGVLAARLDALPFREKQVAQWASIIGREFSVGLLKVISDGRVDLAQALEGLEKGGVIAKLENGERYRFRQRMIRDVAYHTLLHRDRKRCHRLLAGAMESLYRNNISTHLASLAYHFHEAEEWSKALGYTLEAGAQARRSYACEEARLCFDRGLEILTRSPPDGHEEMALQLYGWKGQMHACLGQREKALKAFDAMLSKARSLNNRATEAEACFRIGWISFYMHQPRRARKYLLKAIELSKEEDLAEMLLRASSFLGFICTVLGKLEEARALLISSMDLSMDLKDTEGKAWNVAYLLQYYNWIGEFGEALHLNEELKNLNRKVKSPYFNIFQRFTAGLILGALGRTEEARRSLEAGFKQLEAGDDLFWRPRFLNTMGWTYAEEGKIEDALKLNRKALEEAMESGDPETLHNAEINLGENYLALGDLSEAGKILEKTWSEVKRPGVFYARWRYKTRLFIALGELYNQMGERTKGLDFIKRATRLSQRYGVRKHQARALLVRGRLLKGTQPSLARRSLEKALSLSEKMGTRLLSIQIRQELQAGLHDPHPRSSPRI
jgi:class 3 adenylate cyclase/tetratricopeptide (TPR) repeat protein